jgi:flagellar basal-body rod protein FlgF
MPYGLYISAEGAQAQSRWLEVIANNLANVDTVGFKRELAVFQARYAEAVQQGTATPGSGSVNDLGGGVEFRETRTDFSQAGMARTKNPTDVAIHGDGFFQVRKGQETLLTRAGNFRITSTGALVTQQGYPVLSESGAPVVLAPNGGPCEITPTGAVCQAGTSQSLALVSPASLSDLSKVGENLFHALAPPQPLPAAQRNVAPGYLEMSGVQPTTEMVGLIEASRLLEANVNMLKTQDQMLGGLVNRVLKV